MAIHCTIISYVWIRSGLRSGVEAMNAQAMADIANKVYLYSNLFIMGYGNGAHKMKQLLYTPKRRELRQSIHVLSS